MPGAPLTRSVRWLLLSMPLVTSSFLLLVGGCPPTHVLCWAYASKHMPLANQLNARTSCHAQDTKDPRLIVNVKYTSFL